MNSKLLYLAAPLLLVLMVAGGCNIFSWTDKESAESLIEEGREHMRDAEYDLAASKFAQALEEEPDNSEARYYHAKATIHASGFNSLNLGETMSESDFGNDDLLPFTGSGWPEGDASRLLGAVTTVYDDLKPIHKGQTTGPFSGDDIDLDLAVAAGIRGILFFRDTNGDGKIDADDFNLRIEYRSNHGFMILNLPEYSAGASASPRPNLNPPAGMMPQDPLPIDPDLITAFNTLVDSAAIIIAESRDIITDILTKDFGLDPAEIDDLLEEVVLTAHWYRVADGIDNDADTRIDEEVVDGVDNDLDGRIDEDSNGWYIF